ncbi:unannotated protein [freshwater metagenome]|uniref:Unannotated protein n=1 Tax=freshwater metagenome TaxID=449393 RepID=A0A6J6WBT4_9ZZZZ
MTLSCPSFLQAAASAFIPPPCAADVMVAKLTFAEAGVIPTAGITSATATAATTDPVVSFENFTDFLLI